MADSSLIICGVCLQPRGGTFFRGRYGDSGQIDIVVCASCALTVDIALFSAQLPEGDEELALSVEVLEGVHRRLAAAVAELQAASSPQQEASEAERQDAEIRQEAPLGR